MELELRGIPFREQVELHVFYKGRKLNKRYIPDLIVHEHIVVELRAVRELFPEHES